MAGWVKRGVKHPGFKADRNDIYVIAQLLRLSLQTNRDNLPEIPDSLYFAQMLSNVAALRETGYVYQDTPAVPEQPLNTYGKINDVEHILHDIYKMYNANNSRFDYCGEICAGEALGVL